MYYASGFNQNSGGGGLWQLIAGVLSPITTGLTQFLVSLGGYSIETDGTAIGINYDDGVGNEAAVFLEGVVVNSFAQDALGNNSFLNINVGNLELGSQTASGTDRATILVNPAF